MSIGKPIIRMTGIEPARPKALEPKSSASASSATSATDVFKLFAWNNFYIITSFELSVNTFLKLVLSSGTLGSGPVGMSPYHSIYTTRFKAFWQPLSSYYFRNSRTLKNHLSIIDWWLISYYYNVSSGTILSAPKYGRSTSGIVTVPSAFW